MKIGMATLGHIPKCIDDVLQEMADRAYAETFGINIRVLPVTRRSIICGVLMAVDRLLSGVNDIVVSKSNYLTAEIEDVDIIICWQADPKDVSSIQGKDIWTFWLNNKRFDDPLAGLECMFDRDTPIHLAIRSSGSNYKFPEIYSVKIKPARTFSRTRELAILHFGIMLRKCLDGYTKTAWDIILSSADGNYEFKPTRLLASLIIRNIKNEVFKRAQVKKSYWKLYLGITGDLPKTNTGLKCISPPDDRFWADPFLLEHQGRNYIFIEEFIYESRKGTIAVLEQGKDGDFIRTTTVLEESYHLSYPNVFYIDNSLYMIPETGSQKNIQLYSCIEFPRKWEKVRDILKGVQASDTTVFYYENLWWIFTSVNLNRMSQDEQLYLYCTDSILSGQLTLHPGNPIAFGSECSRMAGNIFKRNGKMYRPAQDCSRVYGGRVVIMEIDKFTKTEYVEHPVSTIEPTQGLIGLHTYNEGKEYFVIDAYKEY